MLPKFWQVVSLFNPVVYLISGFRWAFYNNSDVSIAASLFAITIFTVFCIFIIFLIFKTGWRLRP
jgi:ABC-2 type transport system permease protein|tara:strand:- start:144 stop:338 length:195 start_codon:yes stop_codon:yes gene_type:complete